MEEIMPAETDLQMQMLANGDIVDTSALPDSARSTLYKTEFCKHFMESGFCKYGSKCQFAHGEDELRGVLRNPKYKTSRCKSFSTTGKCAYGNRCRFIHEEVAKPWIPSTPSNKKILGNLSVNEKKSTFGFSQEVDLSLASTSLSGLRPLSMPTAKKSFSPVLSPSSTNSLTSNESFDANIFNGVDEFELPPSKFTVANTNAYSLAGLGMALPDPFALGSKDSQGPRLSIFQAFTNKK